MTRTLERYNGMVASDEDRRAYDAVREAWGKYLAIDNRIAELSAYFNSTATVNYRHDNGRWHVTFPEAYLCVEKGRLQGESLSGSGDTLDEAIDEICKKTVRSNGDYLISNKPFGNYSCISTGAHVVTVYERGEAAETFAFDAGKVREKLQKLNAGLKL